MSADSIRPRADAFQVLAAALESHRIGRLDRAESAYRTVLSLEPGMAVAWNNLGGILRERGRAEEALICFRRAVDADGGLAEAHFNLGYLLEAGMRPEDAMAAYERALSVDPENAKALSQLVFLKRSVCDWKDLAAMERRLDGLVRIALNQGRPVAETPFKSIARAMDPAFNAAVARFWSQAAARQAAAPSAAGGRRDRGKGPIVVGYLSDRFRNAATAHQMLGIFGLHQRRVFEIHAYSYGVDDQSLYRRRIAADCDRFVDIAGMDDDAAARCIAANRVDILVDLKGHTENGRLGICARRPAPVQISWLGYPGPVGAEFFDYLICDRVVVPDADRFHFTASPVRMPHSYYPTDHGQAVAPGPWRRSDFGLPEDAVVLASFNQPFKIDPVFFDIWMTVMARLPQTVLWLQEKSQAVTANLKQAAADRGVDPHRLIFAQSLPKEEHLGRLALADLCLDTRIYNGHTTTADALWVGVPVVAMRGAHFASRVSASLLAALGLPELVADSLAGYAGLIFNLAADGSQRRAVSERIAASRPTAPLFDTPRFVRHLETAFREIWAIHRRGDSPRPLDIASEGRQ